MHYDTLHHSDTLAFLFTCFIFKDFLNLKNSPEMEDESSDLLIKESLFMNKILTLEPTTYHH